MSKFYKTKSRLATAYLSLALCFLPMFRVEAEDFQLVTGQQYKNAEVVRYDVDGLVINDSRGVPVKLQWGHLAPAQRAKHRALAEEAAVQASNKREISDALARVTVLALVEPFIFGNDRTTAHIQAMEAYETGGYHSETRYRESGDPVIGVIVGKMRQGVGSGDQVAMKLYLVGHTDDSTRHLLFTEDPEVAARMLAEKAATR